MRLLGIIAGAALLSVTAGSVEPMAAQAQGQDWGINGQYLAVSNGQYARTNEVFHDEVSVRSTWTVTTQCTFPTVCEGQVISDQGWTAPIYDRNGLWYVKRVVDNWEPCGDGTAAPGIQMFSFYAGDPLTGLGDPTANSYFGQDVTTGPSGACGHNAPLEIVLPFKLIPAG